jgi:phospholipase/lecithinase/hemolysin
MKNFAATLAVSVAFAFGNIAAPAGATVLDPFLVFGDSLSDAGYFGQQATNGNTWAAQLGATTVPFSPSYNFAQGGARASGDNTGLPALDPKDFSEQIAVFDTVAPAVSPDTWAVVWFGGNDFLNTAAEVIGSGLNLNDPNDQATAFAQVQMAATDAIEAIASGILALELRSIRNILVPGLPDLGSLPQFSDPLLAALAPLASEAS